MQYNLGCGDRKLDDFVNIDKNPNVHPDIVADVTVIPWDWAKENEAELIFTDNLFEHIYPAPLLLVYQECHKVLKPNGLLHIIVPLNVPDNYLAVYSDPMHVNHNFTMETFDYYDCEHPRWQNYGRVYGIPEFKRVKQARKGRFLTVELRVVK